MIAAVSVASKPVSNRLPGFLAPSARVVTPGGYVRADQLNVGQLIATGRHGFRPVAESWRGIETQGVVHLVTRGVCYPATLNPEQPVWAIKGESKKCSAMGLKWDALIGEGDRPQAIPADFISPGDYIHVPAQPGSLLTLSEDLAWAYGLYLAEGSSLIAGGAAKRHYRVCMTMHERELSILERFAAILALELDMTEPRVHLRKRVNFTSEYVHSGQAHAEHFRSMFGHGSGGKTVPAWAHDLAPQLKRALVQGWVDGDGHTAQKKGYTQTSATTVSKMLAMQLYQLAVSAGLRPAMSMLSAGGRRKRDSYTIHFNSGQESVEVNGQLFYRVNARYRSAAPTQLMGVNVDGATSIVVENLEVML